MVTFVFLAFVCDLINRLSLPHCIGYILRIMPSLDTLCIAGLKAWNLGLLLVEICQLKTVLFCRAYCTT